MVLASMVIAASVMFVHLFSQKKTEEIYLGETEKVILLLKKDFLSDTVHNLIMEIDSLREQKEAAYQLNTDARKRRFEEEYYVSDEEFAAFYENRFLEDLNQDLWTAVLINEETDEVLYATDHLEQDSPSEMAKNLEKLFQEHKRSPGSTAVMMVDIDRFKNINDTYGHDVGDEVLKKVTMAIHHMIRNTDHLIRWGGDDFVGVFPGMKEEYLREFGEKISVEVEKLHIESAGKPLKVTLSMGFTMFRAMDGSYEDALKRADLALYESKNLGRNQVTVF